jgi:hypothetical protein
VPPDDLTVILDLAHRVSRPERAFIGWTDPASIVAASTGATFGAPLSAAGIGGADEQLPVTFLVIVATVAVYGRTPATRFRKGTKAHSGCRLKHRCLV